MTRSRFWIALAVVILVAVVGGAAWWNAAHRGSRVPMTPEVAWEMRAGAEYADSLARIIAGLPAESIPAHDAVAAGYLERLRLGLGSPFRLIDHVLADPLLPHPVRRLVAYAILDRTLRGDAYHPPAMALGLAGPSGDLSVERGARHVALIDSVVDAARDPRAGEHTVRLAYRLAAAAGSVGRRGPWLGTQAAALARDRVLARKDAYSLLATARGYEADPLALLSVWRRERRFAVERPVMEPLRSELEEEALDGVPRLAAALDSLVVQERRAREAAADTAATDTADVAFEADAPEVPSAPRAGAGLGESMARRLAWVAAQRAMPPQAPVTVAVTSTARSSHATRPTGRAAEPVARFTERARNEETLAAEYALVARRDSTNATPALSVLWSAVSMRAYGQEMVWFPGSPGPSVPELKDRFGLASLSFDASVPTAWRPYYLNMLASALTDLQRVLPALNVRGLGVHFGDSPMRDAALAMHDPATRTIFLPTATSAGVIAHELAHDLDWQTARSRYGLRGTYSTDRAVRQYRDRLAASMLELSDAGPGENTSAADGIPAVPSQRPTEVFARNVDWFVSAALAREGRMNGYLSAVQDGVLIGYGAVAAPEAAREGAQAMVRALDEMTVVAPATRSWFVESHGRGRTPAASDLVRRVLEVRLTASDRRWRQGRRLDGALQSSGESAARMIVALSGSCYGAGLDERTAESRAELLVQTADSRARGLLERRARYAAASQRASWQSRALLGNAWDLSYGENARAELRDAILSRALESMTPRGGAAVVASSPLGCLTS